MAAFGGRLEEKTDTAKHQWKEEYMERIRAIIEAHCLKEIDETEELLKSKILDSFHLLEVICELEETYGIEFGPDEIGDTDHFSSINNIRQLISEKLAVH